jgi:hypothetical protein
MFVSVLFALPLLACAYRSELILQDPQEIGEVRCYVWSNASMRVYIHNTYACLEVLCMHMHMLMRSCVYLCAPAYLYRMCVKRRRTERYTL